MPHPAPTHPRVGVGCLVWKDGQVLLIRRGKPPGYGEWSLPGGSQELGETLFQAAEREVREETGITARARSILTAVDNIVRDADGVLRFHYTIVDVTADWVSGDPVPADMLKKIVAKVPVGRPGPGVGDRPWRAVPGGGRGRVHHWLHPVHQRRPAHALIFLRIRKARQKWWAFLLRNQSFIYSWIVWDVHTNTIFHTVEEGR